MLTWPVLVACYVCHRGPLGAFCVLRYITYVLGNHSKYIWSRSTFCVWVSATSQHEYLTVYLCTGTVRLMPISRSFWSWKALYAFGIMRNRCGDDSYMTRRHSEHATASNFISVKRYGEKSLFTKEFWNSTVWSCFSPYYGSSIKVKHLHSFFCRTCMYVHRKDLPLIFYTNVMHEACYLSW